MARGRKASPLPRKRRVEELEQEDTDDGSEAPSLSDFAEDEDGESSMCDGEGSNSQPDELDGSSDDSDDPAESKLLAIKNSSGRSASPSVVPRGRSAETRGRSESKGSDRTARFPECGEIMLPGECYVKHKAHRHCHLASRALERKLSSKQLTGLRQLRFSDDPEYKKNIKEVARDTQPGRKYSRRNFSFGTAVSMLDAAMNSTTTRTRKISQMLSKWGFVSHMKKKFRMRSKAAVAQWRDNLKDPSIKTYREHGILVMAVAKPTELHEDEDDTITK